MLVIINHEIQVSQFKINDKNKLQNLKLTFKSDQIHNIVIYMYVVGYIHLEILLSPKIV